MEEQTQPQIQESPALEKYFLPATGQTINVFPDALKETNFIYKEIFEDKTYSLHGLVLRPGDIVFDVGANIGFFYLYFMHAAFERVETDYPLPPVRYYGFEAIPPVFDVLARNVRRHSAAHPDRVAADLFNIAIGREARDAVPFTFYPYMPGNSTLNHAEKVELQAELVGEHAFEGATQYHAQMRTLSEYIDELQVERVDYLKIDVEGAELLVLQGVRDEHWSKIWQIAIEVPNAHEVGEDGEMVKRVNIVIDLLESRGFKVNMDICPLPKNVVNFMVYAKRL